MSKKILLIMNWFVEDEYDTLVNILNDAGIEFTSPVAKLDLVAKTQTSAIVDEEAVALLKIKHHEIIIRERRGAPYPTHLIYGNEVDSLVDRVMSVTPAHIISYR